LKYAPRAWKQERLVWTTVVQLNLIRNVNNILDVVNQELATQHSARADPSGDVAPQAHDLFSEKHKILKLRLAPLRGVQVDLERKLGSGAFEDQGNHTRGRSQSASVTGPTEYPLIDGDLLPRRLPKEFYIRSNNSWKDRLKHGLRTNGRPSSGGSIHDAPGAWGGNGRDVSLSEWAKGNTDLEDITGVIAGCRDDIKAVWEDEVVQRVLSKKKYRVDESSGLCVLCFLDRLTTEN
jgi:guanine nucleotide-binding protein alpha-1 subunit